MNRVWPDGLPPIDALERRSQGASALLAIRCRRSVTRFFP